MNTYKVTYSYKEAVFDQFIIKADGEYEAHGRADELFKAAYPDEDIELYEVGIEISKSMNKSN